MDQHCGRIALLLPQRAVIEGGYGANGITVFPGQFRSSQTRDDVVNQPRKVPGASFIVKMKVVELRCVP